MTNEIVPGGITDFSTLDVDAAWAGRMPCFQLRGYGGRIESAEQRRDVSSDDDASRLVMRTVDAAQDSVVGSVVTVTGQVVIWCHTIVLYSATLTGYDGIWMSPLVRGFFAGQVYLESDEWLDFWLSTQPAGATILGPEARLRKAAPAGHARLVHEDEVRRAGLSSGVHDFLCTKSGGIHFSSDSAIGCTFLHWGLESVVTLPRCPPK
jgi:hypothetical protein